MGQCRTQERHKNRLISALLLLIAAGAAAAQSYPTHPVRMLVPYAAGGASDVAYFAGFALFPLVGAWHQDRRKLATMPEFRAFYERTPFFPFTGRQTGRGLHELPIVAVGIALLVTITIRYFHGRLFGG